VPDSQIDPSRLEGEALARWYRRSPEDIDRERQAQEDRRYQAFFNPATGRDIDPGFAIKANQAWRDIDPGFAITSGRPGRQIGPGFAAVPAGPNRWRMARVAPDGESVRLAAHPPTQPGMNIAAIGATPPTDMPTPQRPDPSRTNVFEPGPDGKLRPVPGWHTTGPFDRRAWSHNIDWGGVGKDLGNIASGAADFIGVGAIAGGLAKHLSYDIGGDVIRGIVQGHHPWPRFMGGPAQQELARLHQSLHTKFHGQLGAALKDAGFPRVGGIGGSTEDWAAHFKLNPQSFDKAVDVLRDTTRQFDKKNGTWISKYLDRALPEAKPPTPSPGG
jgi:hypothetical protein